MARPLSSAVEIDKNSRGWTVLIQVIERANVQTSHTVPPKRMKRFLFTDSQGTKISAIMYDTCIRLFYNLLWPFRRYYISNAVVNYTPAVYRVSEYEYSWIINSTTLVEPHLEQIPPNLPCTFQLTNFADLYRYADTDMLQNVKAVVMHVFPQKQQGSGATARDFVIINEEKKPLLLTLWNEFEEIDGNQIASLISTAPVIVAMRVKVTTFNTLSLTSRMSSAFLLNPPLPDLAQMKDWYMNNKEDLKLLLEAKVYKNLTFLLSIPREYDIITIKAAQDAFKNNQQKATWIKGDAELIRGQTRFWYTSCANCQKSVNADVDWTITCPSCKASTQAELRCRIAIKLTDATGSLDCAVFGQDAEKLIPFTAVKLKEQEESGENIEPQLAESIKKQTIICFLRSYDLEFRGQLQKRHNILKAYTLDEYFMLSSPAIHAQPSITATPYETSVIISQKDASEDQMFSPTTKLIIQEIAEQVVAVKNVASTSIGAKRALFGTENQPELPASSVEPTFSVAIEPVSSAPIEISLERSSQIAGRLAESSKKDTDESPSKKSKGSL